MAMVMPSIPPLPNGFTGGLKWTVAILLMVLFAGFSGWMTYLHEDVQNTKTDIVELKMIMAANHVRLDNIDKTMTGIQTDIREILIIRRQEALPPPQLPKK